MFFLKKAAGMVLSPTLLVVTVLLVGVVLLWLRRENPWGRRLTTTGVVLLLLMGYGIPFTPIMAHLESRYPAVLDVAEHPGVEWVVVLGGGHRSDPSQPITSRIAGASINRLSEGVRLHGALPSSRLIVSGGAIYDPVPNAQVAAEFAVAMGVDPARIVVETRPRATAEEARYIQETVGDDPFFLVTSAVHMPRSVMLFQSLGMDPIPAPTQHRTSSVGGTHPGRFFPSAGRLLDAEATFHELLGMAWAWLRGARVE